MAGKFSKIVALSAVVDTAQLVNNDIRFTKCDVKMFEKKGIEIDKNSVKWDVECELTDENARALTQEHRWLNIWSEDDNKWIIPYKFADGYLGKKEVIIEKFKEFEKKTCVKLEPTDNDARGGLLIGDKGKGCYSFIGKKTSWFQELNLAANCELSNTPLHEVMHALGFWHEHQRPDRDEFVRIHPDLLVTNQNYRRIDKMGYSWEELNPKSEYDFQSIMHYHGTMRTDGTPTIAHVDDLSVPFPHGRDIPDTFSAHDIIQINHAYPCGNNQCTTNGIRKCDINSDCVNDSEGSHCICSAGYEDSTDGCTDIDECELGSHYCEFYQPLHSAPGKYGCSNTPGSFECILLVDECSLGTHDCHENASCTKTDESYTCGCNDGYFGDGKICSVRCATFHEHFSTYENGGQSFPSGTFSVSNLGTMNTVVNQEDTTNWKPTDDWSDRISVIQIEPKCKVEGFSGTDFKGRLSEWRGSATLPNRHEMKQQGGNDKIKSFKCTCSNQSCDSYYSFGKGITPGCPAPQCDVATYTISDSWRKRYSGKREKYGYALRIAIPEEHWNKAGWSVLLRFNNGNNGNANFQLWNANFFNFFRHENSVEVLIHEKNYLFNDMDDTHSFLLLVDQLNISDLPEVYFFRNRVMKHQCFGGHNQDRATSFDRAIQSSGVDSYEDVGFVAMNRKGHFRVRN